MISALTVLGAEESATDRRNWSYLGLADELQRRSARPAEDKRELFRRVVFNALVSNTDDHPRNHALVAPGRDWVLAPAYDLTPDPVRSTERRDLAMECGRFGRVARRDNLFSESPRFGLTAAAANTIIDEMRNIVEREWEDAIRSEGGVETDVRAVARAFVYEGFEYGSLP
ncbi:MAG: HipA domain-containing protein [Gemmatimonadales bacterium]